MWGINAANLPTILATIGMLVLLEGLLSGDNALVLAVMVRHLPRHQQKRALRYGIWGAFVFRLIAVVFASMLLQFWQLKVVGGLYLIYLAVSHLSSGSMEQEEHHEVKPSVGRGFWATVINVEIADIAFSIDSILAAVALAEGLPAHLQANHRLVLGIVYIGGVIGIVMMRLVAGIFLVLLDRFKGLAAGAYYLVAWIGVKLLTSGFYDALHPRRLEGGHVVHLSPPAWAARLPHWVLDLPEFPDWLFWVGMGLIVVVSLLYKPRGGEGPGQEQHAHETPTSPNGSAPQPSGIDAAEKA